MPAPLILDARRLARTLLVLAMLASSSLTGAAEPTWAAGDDVMAMGKDGKWYFAEVLEAKDGLYRVDMLAVAKEWVDGSRVRPRTADEVRAVGAAPAAGVPDASPSKPGDVRVATALRGLGLTPETDADGDYKLELPSGEGRTQLVWILSRTQEWGELEIREVWSPGFRTQGKLDLAMARRLLGENNAKKLGAWRIVGSGDTEAAVFAVHVDAAASADVLKDVLDLVTSVADNMEREVVGTDDH